MKRRHAGGGFGERNGMGDDDLRRRFGALRKVPASEKAVSGLVARIREEAPRGVEAGGSGGAGTGMLTHPLPKRGAPGAWRAEGVLATLFPSRAPARLALATAILTLCVSVPLTFLSARGMAKKQPEKTYIVRFIYERGEAASVNVVGDFNDWKRNATGMRKLQGSSLWVVEVPLPEGLYRYAFLVDETEWAPDPLSEVRIKDDYGMDSSLIVLINENEKGARL
jgi:hypothetical protein